MVSFATPALVAKFALRYDPPPVSKCRNTILRDIVLMSFSRAPCCAAAPSVAIDSSYCRLNASLGR